MLCATTVLATPASAATSRNGVCEAGEFCYYYNSNNKGSVSDFSESVKKYGTKTPSCYVFKSKGKGQGLCIKNRAASVWNRTSKTVVVYFNSDHQGYNVQIPPGAKKNLKGTRVYNNNASHKLVSTLRRPSWTSPVPASARMTAHFGRYPSGGAHNGTDYSAFKGKFKSACTGVVDKVSINKTYANRNAYRKSGSTNYLWINCGSGVRMGYAHWYAKQKPSWIKVGAKVKVGQELINVGNQGNSSGTHLHFQVMQNGKAVDGHKFLQKKGVKNLPRYYNY